MRLDLTGTTLYFGSSRAKTQIAADLSPEQRRNLKYAQEILWESDNASDAEASAMEVRLIRELHANDPAIWLQPLAKEPNTLIWPGGALGLTRGAD